MKINIPYSSQNTTPIRSGSYHRGQVHSRRGITPLPIIFSLAFFPLHFYNNTAILKAMKRRATGLTMQLISPKSSFYTEKVLDTPITGNTITRYSVLGTRYSTSLTFFHNKQHGTFISSLIHKNAQSGFFYPFARFFRIWTVCPRLSAAMAERYFFKGDLP